MTARRQNGLWFQSHPHRVLLDQQRIVSWLQDLSNLEVLRYIPNETSFTNHLALREENQEHSISWSSSGVFQSSFQSSFQLPKEDASLLMLPVQQFYARNLFPTQNTIQSLAVIKDNTERVRYQKEDTPLRVFLEELQKTIVIRKELSLPVKNQLILYWQT